MSAMRYLGDGSFYIGVPARDLTAEEAALHGDVIAGSPLYEAVTAPEAAQADAQAGAEGDEQAGETTGRRRSSKQGGD